MSFTETVIAEMTARALRPAGLRAVFVGGSLARGWAHARSDADIFVITSEPWHPSASAELQTVALRPSTVPVEQVHVDGQRWEIRYWQESQIDQLVDRLSWEAFEAGRIELNPVEAVCVERIPHALLIEGEDWLTGCQERIRDSALKAFLTTRWLKRADGHIEDVVGLLETGDHVSAVHSAQAAFACTADAVSASLGECGQEPKWRGKRVAMLNPELLPFQEYWEIATMRSLDPDDPASWARHVITVCRRISMEIEIG